MGKHRRRPTGATKLREKRAMAHMFLQVPTFISTPIEA
jgi:hypothetical protein